MKTLKEKGLKSEVKIKWVFIPLLTWLLICREIQYIAPDNINSKMEMEECCKKAGYSLRLFLVNCTEMSELKAVKSHLPME